jgi:trehalose synthase
MALREVLVSERSPEGLREFLTTERYQELALAISRADALLDGRTVWSVNSTPRGGGVAELLQSLLPYTRGAGIDARWIVVEGSEPFFALTKRLHNMLHGFPGDGAGLSRADEQLYEETCAANARELAELATEGDVIVLHDPQTAGMADPLRGVGARVVWRCHVGTEEVTAPVSGARSFLLPFVRRADAAVFSRAEHRWDGLGDLPVEVIAPSIDPLSAKNRPLDSGTVSSILQAAGIQADGAGQAMRRAELHGSPPVPAGVPLVAQVSRWDALKDPMGVLEGFRRRIAPACDAHLMLAGPAGAAVADDPESAGVLREVIAAREACPSDLAERIHLASLPMDDADENATIVNALQRRADVMVQKSLAEGFGLTVAEAMWKSRPVVAGAVGGILDQIIDRESGRLVAPADLDGFAEAVNSLLADPAGAELMGAAARERIRDRFLSSRHLEQYAALFQHVLGSVLADVSDERA